MSINKELVQMDKVRTGLRIQQAIRYRGYTQKEVADKLHYTESLISAWCKGKRVPFMEAISLLLQILDCEFEDLIVKEGESKVIPIELCMAKRDAMRESQDIESNKVRTMLYYLYLKNVYPA